MKFDGSSFGLGTNRVLNGSAPEGIASIMIKDKKHPNGTTEPSEVLFKNCGLPNNEETESSSPWQQWNIKRVSEIRQ